MKQPNFKDYETLQEYANALASYENFKKEERMYKLKADRDARIEQAKNDFQEMYPNTMGLLYRSGISWEMKSGLHMASVEFHLYKDDQNVSFTHFSMTFSPYDDCFPMVENKWCITDNKAGFVTEEKLIEKIISRSGMLQQEKSKANELPF